jgi:glycosyltransferase involved in cell wall biosynthesis
MDKYRNPPLRQNDFAVVLCTLDFPKVIRETIDSILASTPAPKLLIIVDQSHPSSTTAVQDFDSHPDVLRIKLPEAGLSWARNVGTAAAMTKGFRFVAYTDDDCTVTSNWLSGFASSFASDPDVAMVFGSTLAAPTIQSSEQFQHTTYSRNAFIAECNPNILAKEWEPAWPSGSTLGINSEALTTNSAQDHHFDPAKKMTCRSDCFIRNTRLLKPHMQRSCITVTAIAWCRHNFTQVTCLVVEQPPRK